MISKFIDFLNSRKVEREIRGLSSNVIEVYKYNFSIENYFPPELDKNDIFMDMWNKKYTLEEVSLDRILYTTQPTVSSTFVKNMKSYTENPTLLKYKNKYWVIDGHHRIVFDRMQKKSTICKIIKK